MYTYLLAFVYNHIFELAQRNEGKVLIPSGSHILILINGFVEPHENCINLVYQRIMDYYARGFMKMVIDISSSIIPDPVDRLLGMLVAMWSFDPDMI